MLLLIKRVTKLSTILKNVFYYMETLHATLNLVGI